jgi:hypothetical protein
MQDVIKEKIVKVIDAILIQENPTLDSGGKVSIEKEILRKEGLDDKEIDNILKDFADKGFLSLYSTIVHYADMLDDDDVVDKNGIKMSHSKKYDLLKRNFVVVIPDFKKLNDYKNQLPELSKHFLYKDRDGYFYRNNQLIEMDKQNIYYKILNILYTFSDETGFMPYEQIDSELIKTGEERNKTQNDYKRIKNAISETQGLFRYAKINGKPLENKSVAGKKLIEIIKGRGIKLNNPKI